MPCAIAGAGRADQRPAASRDGAFFMIFETLDTTGHDVETTTEEPRTDEDTGPGADAESGESVSRQHLRAL